MVDIPFFYVLVANTLSFISPSSWKIAEWTRILHHARPVLNTMHHVNKRKIKWKKKKDSPRSDRTRLCHRVQNKLCENFSAMKIHVQSLADLGRIFLLSLRMMHLVSA